VDELAEGIDFQDEATALGIPAPPIVRTAAGAWMIVLDDSPVRVQGWVDLREPDTSLDPASVGRLVGELHRVPFEGRQPLDEWYTEPMGADRWDALITAAQVANAPFAERFAARRDALVSLDAMVRPPGTTRTCHRDLWSDNLRATADGDLCLIDWENCGLADPSMELATVLWEFGRSDATRARALHEAYRGADGPGHVDETDDFSMAIAQLGHIGARACRDWLEPGASDEERSFAASWFGEFTEEPLTRASIEMLLGAVR
jgi:thiamine kinase-like enzyme